MLEVERRTIRYVHRREYDVGVRINEADLSQTTDNHLTLALTSLALLSERNGTKLIELQTTVVLGHDRSVGGSITCHTTGVERTKCKLSTRLTDSLSSNHTDSLTLLNHTLGSEVTTVALHTNTLLALASEHRTDLDTLDG